MKEELLLQFREKLEIKKNKEALYNARLKVNKIGYVCPRSIPVCDEAREFSKFIKENDLEETNDLYIYCGTFIEEDNTAKGVNRNNPNATCRYYWDIEKPQKIRISIEKCEEFENNHKIINLSISTARQKFLDMSLKTNQEEAVKELCKRYSIK